MASTPAHYDARVVASYPHGRDVFTQGLLFHNGELLESAGMYGESRLLRRSLGEAAPRQETRLARNLFGEGVAWHAGQLYQLTWRNGIALVYDDSSLKILRQISYDGEGWGLTSDGAQLIMSDGSAQLRFLDPDDFTERRRLTVRLNGKPLRLLNELEWIDDRIYANVWQQDALVIIDPLSGGVESVVHLNDLLPLPLRDHRTDVLNGIAWDAEQRRLFVTGKYWPLLFQIELQLRTPAAEKNKAAP